jgi:hypothetical protein
MPPEATESHGKEVAEYRTEPISAILLMRSVDPVTQRGRQGVWRSFSAANAVAQRTQRFVAIGQLAFGKTNHYAPPVILQSLSGMVSSRVNPSICAINAKWTSGWNCRGCSLKKVREGRPREAASICILPTKRKAPLDEIEELDVHAGELSED